MRVVTKLGSVWSQITNSLTNIRSIFAENGIISVGLKKFTLNLVSAATDKIGWDFRPDEDFLTGQLRALLITVAGDAGHEKYVVRHTNELKLIGALGRSTKLNAGSKNTYRGNVGQYIPVCACQFSESTLLREVRRHMRQLSRSIGIPFQWMAKRYVCKLWVESRRPT